MINKQELEEFKELGIEAQKRREIIIFNTANDLIPKIQELDQLLYDFEMASGSPLKVKYPKGSRKSQVNTSRKWGSSESSMKWDNEDIKSCCNKSGLFFEEGAMSGDKLTLQNNELKICNRYSGEITCKDLDKKSEYKSEGLLRVAIDSMERFPKLYKNEQKRIKKELETLRKRFS